MGDEGLSAVVVMDAAVEVEPFSQEALLSFWQGPEPCMISIMLRSTGERKQDTRRMRHIHGLLSSDPGGDQFAFQVYEADRHYDLKFPNSTTRYSLELHTKLVQLVGEDCVKVGPLRLH
jgi:hypothetical protein